MRLSELFRWLILMLSCALFGCSAVDVTSGNEDAPELRPAPVDVVGTITWVRGWGATDFPQPDSSYFEPQPLALVDVDLMEFISDQDPPGRIVASTHTNSKGQFVLFAPPGTYYLVVRAAEYARIQMGGPWFSAEDRVSNLEVVELRAGQVLVRDFEIHEMVPQ